MCVWPVFFGKPDLFQCRTWIGFWRPICTIAPTLEAGISSAGITTLYLMRGLLYLPYNSLAKCGRAASLAWAFSSESRIYLWRKRVPTATTQTPTLSTAVGLTGEWPVLELECFQHVHRILGGSLNPACGGRYQISMQATGTEIEEICSLQIA
jgi:hypothetical protein